MHTGGTIVSLLCHEEEFNPFVNMTSQSGLIASTELLAQEE